MRGDQTWNADRSVLTKKYLWTFVVKMIRKNRFFVLFWQNVSFEEKSKDTHTWHTEPVQQTDNFGKFSSDCNQ